METSRVAPLLWGLAAALLLFLLVAVFFNTQAFRVLGTLLGVAALALGLVLAGLGLAAAAMSVGTRIMEAFGLLETESFGAGRLGLWFLGLTAAVPIVGWLLTLLLLASGIGSVLEVLVARKSSDHAE